MLRLYLMNLFPALFQVFGHTVVTPDLISQNQNLLLLILHNFSDEKFTVTDLADGTPREIIALWEYSCFRSTPETEC